MGAKSSAYFWSIAWGALSLVLLAVLVFESRYGRPSVGEGPRPPAKVAEARLLPAFSLAESQIGGETLARPLFVPSRRPPPPAATGPGSVKRGQYMLQGTTIVGDLRIALLKELASGTVHRVEMGAEIGGMTLAEVAPGKVVLRSGDESETLPLVVAKASGPAGAAVVQGPFGSAAPAAGAAPASAKEAEAKPGAAAQPQPATGTYSGSRAVGRPRGDAVTPAAPESGAADAKAEQLTPEQMIARRRAARRAQPQN